MLGLEQVRRAWSVDVAHSVVLHSVPTFDWALVRNYCYLCVYKKSAFLLLGPVYMKVGDPM